ncbi:MAG: glycosyltransferase, partial [Muribaculaceae bacterium]|nr:glycosyltransferase [Muribaculaceae bacterium]
MQQTEPYSNKKLGVIILNWNGLELLKRFIPVASKFTHGDNVELTVADNGSTDGSIEWLRANHPEVRIIAFDQNYGFSGGYNRALREGGYRYT